MAMTYREAVAGLLGVLEREGGFREPRDQVVIAQARTLLAVSADDVLTIVRCNTQGCPSRLELRGDLEPAAAADVAIRMHWWTDGTLHLCPSCKEL